jgi:hypothetical protein
MEFDPVFIQATGVAGMENGDMAVRGAGEFIQAAAGDLTQLPVLGSMWASSFSSRYSFNKPCRL